MAWGSRMSAAPTASADQERPALQRTTSRRRNLPSAVVDRGKLRSRPGRAPATSRVACGRRGLLTSLLRGSASR